MAKNENFLLTDHFCQCVKLKTFSCTPNYAHCKANINQRIETSMNRHTICEGKNHKAPENCRNLIMQWTELDHEIQLNYADCVLCRNFMWITFALKITERLQLIEDFNIYCKTKFSCLCSGIDAHKFLVYL